LLLFVLSNLTFQLLLVPGKTLQEAIASAKEQVTVDPNKDLNKADDGEVGF